MSIGMTLRTRTLRLQLTTTTTRQTREYIGRPFGEFGIRGHHLSWERERDPKPSNGNTL